MKLWVFSFNFSMRTHRTTRALTRQPKIRLWLEPSQKLSLTFLWERIRPFHHCIRRRRNLLRKPFPVSTHLCPFPYLPILSNSSLKIWWTNNRFSEPTILPISWPYSDKTLINVSDPEYTSSWSRALVFLELVFVISIRELHMSEGGERYSPGYETSLSRSWYW